MTQRFEVTFVLPDGARRTLVAETGETLMDLALDNGVPGILAQCGGGCTCCTCHCYVPEPWASRLPAPDPDERELLAYAWAPRADSRLACQVWLDPSHDGLIVEVPAEQS